MNGKGVYMDNHATTPVDPRVFEAMRPFFTDVFGNAASRSHPFGWEAEKAVETARDEIAKITREKGVLFHTDAVQGVGKLPIDVEAMNIDLLSMTAHKIYGPKGVGALYVRSKAPRVRLVPIIDGGGHERGFRSGTLNVPGIVGFGKACELCRVGMADESQRVLGLRERLHEKLFSALDDIYLNGHPVHRLPGNLNVSFSYVEGESLLMGLNGSTHPIAVAESEPPIAVSSGSACTSATLEPSYVLKALGVGDDLAHTSIRFGLGRFNTAEEVDYVTNRVVHEVRRLRELSPLYEMAKEGIDLKSVAWQRD